MGRTGIDDNEVLSGLTLSRDEQAELLEAQTECSFVFLNAEGWPSGVVMSFIAMDGGIWLTSVEGRPQVAALAVDARISIVVSSAGSGLDGRRMLAIRGRAVVHRDSETKARFYPRFARRLQPDDPAAFEALLDSPRRVVIEVVPVAITVSHDSRKMAGNGRGGGTR